MLHTFRNGVNGCVYGDDIPDTPLEATPAFGRSCNMNSHRKICPGTPGIDPVWNIMDYSDDYYASEFTPDQVDMMRYYLETYRENSAIHEPLRCVASGSRGSALPLTVCLSQCFVSGNAPDGRPAPQSGWCLTDTNGGWGECCCDASCRSIQTQVPFSSTLSCACASKQSREEVLKNPRNRFTSDFHAYLFSFCKMGFQL